MTTLRAGKLHDILGDKARIVPEVGPEGVPPAYSAVLILVGGSADAPAPARTEETPAPARSAAAPATARSADAPAPARCAAASPVAGASGDGLPFPADATVLLTHRAADMRTHSGQMAFPGGRWEEQDSGPVATALREAWEETGLDPASVTPLAVGQPVYIDRSNFAVVPVLAYWHAPGRVFPASEENDWVQAYPLAALTEPAARFQLGYMRFSGPAFDVDGMVLWGFTAGVLSALIRAAGWERPWDATTVHDLFEVLHRSANKEALVHMREHFAADARARAGGDSQ